MQTIYHLANQEFSTFADLCMAYKEVYGYYPTEPIGTVELDGKAHLYY